MMVQKQSFAKNSSKLIFDLSSFSCLFSYVQVLQIVKSYSVVLHIMQDLQDCGTTVFETLQPIFRMRIKISYDNDYVPVILYMYRKKRRNIVYI